ncbi:MAG TPA: PEP/pyruvate-binding domain-containing protein [Vicinamibacterales bacterium]
MEPTLKTLDEITDSDRSRVGGKAYNCARLKQAGFPVPDGLVVPADASEQEIALLPNHPWFRTVLAGELFAVRSSGAAEDSAGDSFAGMHETTLNVDCAGLVDAVRHCRRSADSEQARAYRAARHLPADQGAIAVLVQRMVPAVNSGVAFTVNPVTGANEIVVNSIAGLGDALVSGQVNPDEHRLSKTDTSELARLAVGIEAFYRSPQDIEWCFDGQRYWIVQSRPVTTTVRPEVQAALSTRGSEIEWTRANLAEVFPDQLAPQVLDTYVPLLDKGERAFFGRLMAPEAELGPIIKAFYGRLYFNLSQLRHVTDSVGAAFANTLRSLGHPEQIHPDDEVVPKPSLKRFLRVVPDIIRLTRYDLRMARIFHDHQARSRQLEEQLTHVNPATLSDTEIWATIQQWLDAAPEAIPAVFVMSSVQAREDVIRKACARVGFSYEALAYPNLAAGARSVSTEQAFDVIALANVARCETRSAEYLRRNDGTFADFRTALAGTNFLTEFEQFLGRYGHRGRYESDWSLPRMREQPASVLFAIREQLDAPAQDPVLLSQRQAAQAASAWQQFEARLTTWQRWTLLPRVRKTLRQLKQQYLWREEVRSDLTRVLAALRPYHLTLAGRFVERGWLDRLDDYFLLVLEEVRQACEDPARGDSLRAIAAKRAAERAAQRDLRLPLFMRESELPALMAARASNGQSDVLKGLCVSPGSIDGEVVVMRDPGEFTAMKRGAILVAPATDPSWTPLFTLASGVIVEVGGMLSHASTIAREYGLPALANVKDATRVLKSGDHVRLDASGGVVQRLSKST